MHIDRSRLQPQRILVHSCKFQEDGQHSAGDKSAGVGVVDISDIRVGIILQGQTSSKDKLDQPGHHIIHPLPQTEHIQRTCTFVFGGLLSGAGQS